MTAWGLAYSGAIEPDGKLHRIPDGRDKRGKRSAWYVLHIDGRPAGAFGSWKNGGEKIKWTAEGAAPVSPEERAALRQKAREDQARRRQEELDRQAHAARRANEMWDAAKDAADHPYLRRKGVKSFGLRVGDWVKEKKPDAKTGEVGTWVIKNALLIPVRDETKAIVGLQAVFDKPQKMGAAERDKDFIYGQKKRGCFVTIGKPQKVDGEWLVMICEGYATGASAHCATGHAVLCALDAGNLLHVGRLARKAFGPKARIVFLADNDQWTERPVTNPGVTKAREAAREISGDLVFPTFCDESERPTDFNDLARLEGLSVVTSQILNVLAQKQRRPCNALPTQQTPIPTTLGRPPDDEFESRPPEFTDDALAEELIDRFGSTLRYVGAWGRWFSWTGTCWKEDETHRVYHRARLVCRTAALSCAKENLARPLASAKTVSAVERLGRTDPRIAATTEQWDVEPWALNTPAGVVDLRTGEVRAHRPDDFMTRQTKVAPGGPCPAWERFLAQVTAGDQDLCDFLQRIAGYSLTGVTREHVMFFAYGSGGNGKGTFLNTLTKILGSYARTAAMQTFTATAVDHHPTELAMLRGARLVTAQETEEGTCWAEARIKTLTGGDPITARFMRQDFFTYQPAFKLFIAGNHQPRLRNVDEAIRRRLCLLPFRVSIPKTERDPCLDLKLAAEASGILAWAVQGCLAYQSEGLNIPASVSDMTSEYLEEQDSLGLWLNARCRVGAGHSATLALLWESWSGFADEEGLPLGGKHKFSARLSQRGFTKKRQAGKGATQFEGVTLIQPHQPERS